MDPAQHLAHVAEPIPGPAEQLQSLADVHRGVVRHWGDRELELTDLFGDCLERLEVDLAPCGGGGVEVMRALRKGQGEIFALQGGIVGEARIVDRAFGVGPCVLTEAMAWLQDSLASAQT